MNPAVLKTILAVLSLAVVITKGLLTGSFDGTQLADVLGGLLAGAALIQRPGDAKKEEVK